MCKTIKCTSDVRTIKELLADDYDQVIYDGCPSFEDFQPDLINSIWFILYDKSDTCGLIKMENLNWVTWVPHIVIKKEYRGNGSEKWGQQVIEYMKKIFTDVNYLVITPYISAKKYAERLGFKYMGIMPNSIKKNGKLMDQHILTGEAL